MMRNDVSINKYMGVSLLLCLFITAPLFFLSEVSANNIKILNSPLKQQTEVPGEYIVTVRNGGDDDFLRSYFSKYNVSEVKKISEDMFLIKFIDDPGLLLVEEYGLKSDKIVSVQHNFIYHTQKPKRHP